MKLRERKKNVHFLRVEFEESPLRYVILMSRNLLELRNGVCEYLNLSSKIAHFRVMPSSTFTYNFYISFKNAKTVHFIFGAYLCAVM